MAKPTKRAKRLEKYLRDVLGWETGTGLYTCRGCGKKRYQGGGYCDRCGEKMPKKSDRATDGVVFDDLEKAIAHALEEWRP